MNEKTVMTEPCPREKEGSSAVLVLVLEERRRLVHPHSNLLVHVHREQPSVVEAHWVLVVS